jgi:hypothetical protein
MTQIRNHTPIEVFMSGSRPGKCFRIDPQTGERTEIKRTAPKSEPSYREAQKQFWETARQKALQRSDD